jgi:hypothetical protein
MPKTYEKIATTTLGSAASSVTFSSISGAYTDLILVMNVGGSVSGNAINMTFNSDTSTNYSDTGLWGTGTSAASGRHVNATNAALSIGIGVSTNAFDTQTMVQIQNYSNTTTYKTYIARTGNTAGSYPGTEVVFGLWRSTAAISTVSVACGANWVTGSTFTLYGIKAA